MEVRRAHFTVATKHDGSPVTSADLAAHALILNGLNDLQTGFAVVSEEDQAQDRRPQDGAPFWLIDPLDGTREFVAGSDEFTVNIALVRHGRVEYGFVGVPALGQVFHGGMGLGAWRCDSEGVTRLFIGKRQAHELRVVASRSHLDDRTRAWIEALGPCTLVQAGSSLKFCRIAENRADVYPRFGPTCEWDTAAAHAVLEGAGGTVCQPDGTPLTYGKAEVLNPPFIASAFWPLPLARQSAVTGTGY